MKYRILEASDGKFYVEYKELFFWHSCFDFRWGNLYFYEYICCEESWYEDGIYSRSEANECLKALKALASHKYPNEITCKTVHEEED